MGNNIEISVVLSSYNGEKYIYSQLESIKNQVMQPDEVLIRDDGSIDSTVEIVRDYIKNNNLKNWQLIEGKINIGWKKSFKYLLYKSRGTYIFPCDQDDVWKMNKIDMMLRVMKENADIELLASDMELCIEVPQRDKSKSDYFDLVSILNNKRLFSIYATKKNSKSVLQKVPFGNHFFHTMRPGCVYCVRASLISDIKDFWDDTLPHDAQLWMTAAMKKGLYEYHVPLISFRRHEGTTTGREGFSKKTKIKNSNLEFKLIQLASKINYKKKFLTNNESRVLSKSLKYVKTRKHFLERKRSIGLFCKTISYIKYYFSFKTFIGDAFVVFLKNSDR